MAVVRNRGFSNFLIFNLLVADRVKTTNVHHHTNFIKIDQMIAEISHLTIVKMVTPLRHRGFLKIYFFEKLVRKLWRTNMCDRTKFQQNHPEGFGDIAIFRFSRWPPSTILDIEILKVLVDGHIGGLMYIAIPNFTKIGKTVAEILHLTFFKMALSAILDF